MKEYLTKRFTKEELERRLRDEAIEVLTIELANLKHGRNEILEALRGDTPSMEDEIE